MITGSWRGALTGFFWAGLVRMALLHHVTWSVNSICHVVGQRPFDSRDKATNFWPLALAVLRRKLAQQPPRRSHRRPARRPARPTDPGARLIRIFEKLGWAHDVRWPDPVRLAARRMDSAPLPLR
jgi:stearoyl-CoA desaturase (delta-9 desaturase)